MSEEEKKAKIELLNIPRLSVKKQNARDIILKAIDIKDKVIDLMAEYLNENNREFWTDDIEETKQYFYKKAEEEK